MLSNEDNLNSQNRAYFAQQGQSIANLYAILNSSTLVHHLRKWLSVLLEIILYLSFIFILIGVIAIPTELKYFFELDEYNRLGISIRNADFEIFMIALKFIIALISLPMLLLAILLGRNRKKNELIRQAFEEVMKMKTRIDQL